MKKCSDLFGSYCIREAAIKQVLFLNGSAIKEGEEGVKAMPLRNKKKLNLFSDSEVPTAIKLQGGGGGGLRP